MPIGFEDLKKGVIQPTDEEANRQDGCMELSYPEVQALESNVKGRLLSSCPTCGLSRNIW